MPYVNRKALPFGLVELSVHLAKLALSPGNLNWAVHRLIAEYLSNAGGLSYATLNEVVGVLECVKLELYRRLAAPYEDRKMRENGDVRPYTDFVP